MRVRREAPRREVVKHDVPTCAPEPPATAPDSRASSALPSLSSGLSVDRKRRAQKHRRLVETHRHLSVEDVAHLLHIGKTSVHRMLARGDLHCIQGSSPIRFTREEVLRAAALIGVEVKTIPTDGDIAAQAFRAFKDGRSVRDVVIDCKISPDHAEELLHRYATLGGDLVLPGEVAREIQALGFFQNRSVNPRELPQILGDLLAFCEQVDPEARAARDAWNEAPKPGASS